MSGIAAVIGSDGARRVVSMLEKLHHRGALGECVEAGNGFTVGCVTSHQDCFTSQQTGEPYHTIFMDGQWQEDGARLSRGWLDTGPTVDPAWMTVEGGFALAVMDGERLRVARDPLGIKPLYCAEAADGVYFASELKALAGLNANVRTFPPGHVYDSQTGLSSGFQFQRPAHEAIDTEEAAARLRSTLQTAIQRRIPPSGKVGILLSGGLDSSVVAALARAQTDAIHSFSAGTPDSADLVHAGFLAEMLGTRHHDYVFTEVEARKVLPEVIFHLESFDYPLVRSSMANYLASRMAADHVDVVLCGEGADELFAGYEYLRSVPADELDDRLEELTFSCSSTGLQRVDRMNAAHGVSGRMPFLDWDVIDLAFRLPADFKVHENGRVEKWIVRQAFVEDLPGDIAWRPKQKFSVGSGASQLIGSIAEWEVSDSDFEAQRRLPNGFLVRTKEEMLYYRIFRDFFGDDPTVLNTVGITPVN